MIRSAQMWLAQPADEWSYTLILVVLLAVLIVGIIAVSMWVPTGG